MVDRSWYLCFKICIRKMNVKIKFLSNFSLKIRGEKVLKLLEYSVTMIVMLFSLPSTYFLFVCLVPCFCLHPVISLSDFVSPVSIIIMGLDFNADLHYEEFYFYLLSFPWSSYTTKYYSLWYNKFLSGCTKKNL